MLVNALAYGIPRFADSHRGGPAFEVLCDLRALVQGLGGAKAGGLGRAARPTLRDLADVSLEILGKRDELQEARGKPNRRKRARQLERDLQRLRFQRMKLRTELGKMANGHGLDVAAELARLREDGS